MTRIGLLGDVHGASNVMLDALRRFKKNGITEILQLGDLGVWGGTHGTQFLFLTNKWLRENDQRLWVTLGNHEDYDQVNTWHVYENGWMQPLTNIFVATRGLRWEWEGVSFVSLGGAPSVDRAWRWRRQRPGYPLWWSAEDITREDMDKTMDGGYADVMVAHDAPLGIRKIEKMISGNPFGFTAEDRLYADEGRKKMREVVDTVRPKLYFGGHYHFPVAEKNGDTMYYILAADGDSKSSGELDLETLNFTFYTLE